MKNCYNGRQKCKHHPPFFEDMTHKYYTDYYWDHGRPRGAGIAALTEPQVYKIVVDPYYKRYTLERYKNGAFAGIVYDSALYDFRWLKPQEQTAWHKETIEESETEISCLIRNQDDRVIALEKYAFEQSLCTLCKIYYPNGEHLATQHMTYTKLGAAENRVLLVDRLSHPIAIKHYEADEKTGEFTTLLSEVWNTKITL